VSLSFGYIQYIERCTSRIMHDPYKPDGGLFFLVRRN